jgi:hypothetical protein
MQVWDWTLWPGSGSIPTERCSLRVRIEDWYNDLYFTTGYQA